LKIKHLLSTLTVFVLLTLTAITCFAAENARYELTWEYSITNTSDADISRLPYGFTQAHYATDSPYQPDTAVVRTITTTSDIPYRISDGVEYFKTDLPAHSTQKVTQVWTFSSGGFDHKLQKNALETVPESDFVFIDYDLLEIAHRLTDGLETNSEKALAVYTWITSNIMYGEKQAYGLPEVANCETYSALFHDMLSAVDVPIRKVYGYVLRVVDADGNLTFGSTDISTKIMHAWNEFYDEEYGWTFVDATFDSRRTEYEFFGQCSEQSPHLAMFYDVLPSFYYSVNAEHKANTKWSKTAKLVRIEYTDPDENTENLLETVRRIEDEAVILQTYAEARGLTFEVNRIADCFSLENVTKFNIPADYRVSIDDFGDLNIANDSRSIRLQFSKSGAFRLFM
jgi:transglutaminase-like putative cysteine protease